MSSNQPGVQSRPTSYACPELFLDIERVLGVAARQTIRAAFGFDPAAPLVVSLVLVVEGGPRVLWRIGRDLMKQGLRSASGLGDVQMWPARPGEGGTAWLQLASQDMAALFELPVPPLEEWLEHTYELVPAGRELAQVDWDITTANLPAGS
ncbi:SsgA family sporulation/cell division regulator [Streptomyces sp. 351MFTsu5.1]|uniref:SsgA family sporulation/cell division regulator n=1 Tax=Streptomyces sp. 351MFTsu5.1 TaxID=1172180 RepID=UPI000381B1B5|nr:SsgA family sporulation/cell division regulator [Streptomyces sp. 351MFTsu5.1]